MSRGLHFFIEPTATDAVTVHGQLATLTTGRPLSPEQAAAWGGWSPTDDLIAQRCDLMAQRCSSRTGDEDHPRANSGYRGLSLRAQGKWAPLVSGGASPKPRCTEVTCVTVRVLDSSDIAPDSGWRDFPVSPGAPMTGETRPRAGLSARRTTSRDLVPCHGIGHERSRHAGQGLACHSWDSVRDTESSALSQASVPWVQSCEQEGTTAGRIFIRIAGCTGLRRMQLTPQRVGM